MQKQHHLNNPWLLVASNLIVIILAITQQWSLQEVLWGYWCQSVIIGIFTVLTILTMKNYSLQGFKMDDPTYAKPHVILSLFMAGFFLIHYGGFHAGYAFFLTFLMDVENIDPIKTAAYIFFAEQTIEYLISIPSLRRGGARMAEYFVRPYARIIPMHILIVAMGMFFTDAPLVTMLIFMGLKTLTDVYFNAHVGFQAA